MSGSPRSIEFSVRIYKTLIKAYPASFRREYENEMTLVFREHITDVLLQRGTVGLMKAWFRLLGDLAWSAPKEHFLEMQRRIEMKNAAIAILSVVLAAIAYWGIFVIIAFIGFIPFVVGSNHLFREIVTLLVSYLAAFLTGLILTRMKPFFAPIAIVPLGSMGIFAVWGLLAVLENNQRGIATGWGTSVGFIGFVASVGMASLFGCIVARKESNRLAKFSMPWFQLISPLAVLVCTSFIACVLRIALESNHLVSDLVLRQVLTFCLFALLVIAAVTIANTVFLVIRTYQKAKVQ